MSPVSLSPLILSLMGFTAPAVPDRCMKVLADEYQADFQAKAWSFHGLRAIDPAQLEPRLSKYSGRAVEMTQAQRLEVESYASKNGYEFYLLTGTSNYSAAFMDVLVVKSDDCGVIRRDTVYFE